MLAGDDHDFIRNTIKQLCYIKMSPNLCDLKHGVFCYDKLNAVSINVVILVYQLYLCQGLVQTQRLLSKLFPLTSPFQPARVCQLTSGLTRANGHTEKKTYPLYRFYFPMWNHKPLLTCLISITAHLHRQGDSRRQVTLQNNRLKLTVTSCCHLKEPHESDIILLFSSLHSSSHYNH